MLSFTLAVVARAESLAEIDRVAAEAGSLDALLADSSRLDRYYVALAKYYGADRFPRGRFDAILGQLREMLPHVPELRERLWETTNLGAAFSVESDTKSRGRGFEAKAWSAHYDGWRARLLDEAKTIYAVEKDRDAHVQKILDGAADRLRERRAAKPVGLTRVDEIKYGAEIFGELRSDPEVRAALAYLLREKLGGEHSRDILRAGDPDVVLGHLEGMRQTPRGVIWRDGVRVPEELLPMVGAQVPPLKDWLAKEDIFPVKTRVTKRGVSVADGAVKTGAYETVPIPRRLHGIWKGVSLGECVGGSCAPAHEGYLTPERWLTVAMKDTALWHIERDGGYQGFVQALPIWTNGGTYASIDFGSPLLARNAAMFERWTEALIAHKPPGWEAFVVGQSNAIDNAGALSVARASTNHLLGMDIGEAKGFLHRDPIADKIVEVSTELFPRKIYAGSRMIFDAGVKDAGTLRTLGPTAALRAELLEMGHAAFLARDFSTLPLAFLRPIFGERARRGDRASAIELAEKFLGARGRGFRDLPWAAIDTLLQPWRMPGERVGAIDERSFPYLGLLEPKHVGGVFSPDRNLPLIRAALDNAVSRDDYIAIAKGSGLGPRGLGETVQASARGFFAAAPGGSVRDFLTLGNYTGSVRTMLGGTATPAWLRGAVAAEMHHAGAYRRAEIIREAIVPLTEYFLSLRPTVEETNALAREIPDAQSRIEFVKRAKEMLGNPPGLKPPLNMLGRLCHAVGLI